MNGFIAPILKSNSTIKKALLPFLPLRNSNGPFCGNYAFYP